MKRGATALIATAVSIAPIACGGDDSGAGKSVSAGNTAASNLQVLEISTDPHGRPTYTSTQESLDAGVLRIVFHNPQGLRHNVAIKNSKGELVAETPLITRDTSEITARLGPGTYKYYSSAADDRSEGMEGTLVISD